MSSSAVTYARDNQQRFLGELKDLLRIPSVSTLPEHKDDVRRAAPVRCRRDEAHRDGECRGDPHLWPSTGVWRLAACRGQADGALLRHYDVQPPDPLNEWHTPPFEPTERNQNIYARGAVDDKGQMYMHLKALESLFKTSGGTCRSMCA